MEPDASIDILDRVRDYRDFGSESSTTVARFDASKLRLQHWARDVGIGNGRLTDTHDVRLDDERTASVVRNILYWSSKLFQKVECNTTSLKLPVRQRTENEQWSLPSQGGGVETEYQQKFSKKGRLAWSMGSKTKLAQEVQQFEELVAILHSIVLPREDREASHLEEKLDLLANVGLERLLELATTQRQRNLDKWLDAAKDDDQYDRFLGARLDGTCEWILSHPSYLAWEKRDGKEEVAKLLWIHGPAGFGKTILCASLIRHIREDLQLHLVYCFSSNHAQNVDGLSSVLRTWLTQLVRLDDGAFEIALKFLKERNTRKASEENVWTLLSKVILQIRDCVLVLDGLDEFQSVDDQRKIFLSRLKKCLQSTTTSALITSRSEFDINSELRPSVPEIDKYSILECKISEHTVKSDIDAFASSIVERRLPRQGDSLRKELSARMAERCQGQFLWLKLQQSQLRDSKTPKFLRKSIEVMPQGLRSTYEHSWDSIQALEQPDRGRAIDTLRWLTFALRPLTVQMLAEATAINRDVEDLPDDINDGYIDGEIKQLCGSLVEVQGHGDPGCRVVRLIHASVNDFLASKLPPPFLKVALMESTSNSAHHSILAACCICFLNSAETWMPGSGQRDPSFRTYAANTWFRHLRKSGVCYHDVSDLVLSFVKPGNDNFEMWKKDFEGRSSDLTATSFYYAAELGLVRTMIALHNIHMVEKLLDTGVSLISELHEAMRLAAREGSLEVVKLLLDRGVSVDPPEALYPIHRYSMELQKETTPLLVAAAKSRVEVLKLLLEQGANPGLSSRSKNGEWTALHVAAFVNCHEAVKLLLLHGADVNSLMHSDTPLHMASEHGGIDVVQALLDKGATLDAYNISRRTPLYYAARSGNSDVLAHLLHRGADPTVKDVRGSTPLHEASMKNGVDTVKTLLENGATIDARDDSQVTPLHHAARWGRIDTLAYLLHEGANPNAQDHRGWTPLGCAARRGEMKAITTLLGHGANVNINAQMDRGLTPLGIAIFKNNTEIARLLIDRGADINIPTKDGGTALRFAIEQSDDGFVCDLIRSGADLGKMDHYGMTCSNWLQRSRPHLVMPEVEGQKPDKIASGPDMSVLRGTLLGLSKKIRSGKAGKGVGLYYLARCFLLLDMDDYALRAYNFGSVKPYCEICRHVVVDEVAFFKCKVCPDMDFCQSCMEGHSEGTRREICLSHEFLKVIPLEATNCCDDDDEVFRKWLDEIIEQFTD